MRDQECWQSSIECIQRMANERRDNDTIHGAIPDDLANRLPVFRVFNVDNFDRRIERPESYRHRAARVCVQHEA